jgi:hypothetical protein
MGREVMINELYTSQVVYEKFVKPAIHIPMLQSRQGFHVPAQVYSLDTMIQTIEVVISLGTQDGRKAAHELHDHVHYHYGRAVMEYQSDIQPLLWWQLVNS